MCNYNKSFYLNVISVQQYHEQYIIRYVMCFPYFALYKGAVGLIALYFDATILRSETAISTVLLASTGLKSNFSFNKTKVELQLIYNDKYSSIIL